VTIGPSLSLITNEMANASSQTLKNAIANGFEDADAVAQAQQASKAQRLQDEQTAEANAASFAQLEAKGIGVQTISFGQTLKSSLAQAVDKNNDGTVSTAELTSAVEAGGGTAAQAAQLYGQMDENGDGVVTDAEFEDSVPVPQTSHPMGLASLSAYAPTSDPILDASLFMGNLARLAAADGNINYAS
jgi:EF hand